MPMLEPNAEFSDLTTDLGLMWRSSAVSYHDVTFEVGSELESVEVS